jgi:hypothetical protein
MTEEQQQRSLWDRLFSADPRYQDERERRVLEYLIHRIGDGAHLRDVMGEEYVRRNASPQEVDEILGNPKLIEAAHEKLKDDFASGRLDPKAPPSD